MNNEVYTLEWAREAKEFRVVKVPRPTDGACMKIIGMPTR